MRHPIKKGNDQINARAKHRAQPAKPFDNIFLRLRNNPHPKQDAENDKSSNQKR